MIKSKTIFIFFVLILCSSCHGGKKTREVDEGVGQKTKDKELIDYHDIYFKKGQVLRLYIKYDMKWGDIPNTSNDMYGNLMISDNYFEENNKEWRKYHIIGHDKIKKFAIDCNRGKNLLYYSIISEPLGEFGYPIDYKIVEVGDGGEVDINKKTSSGKYIYDYMCKNTIKT